MELRGSSWVKHARAMGSKERTRNRESMRIWELMRGTEGQGQREPREQAEGQGAETKRGYKRGWKGGRRTGSRMQGRI